jgi:uncharacterized damage-inducible protein DinB
MGRQRNPRIGDLPLMEDFRMEAINMDARGLLDYWERVRAGLIDTIDGFSDDELDFKAFDRAYTVRQLILHIAHEEYGEVQYGLTGRLSQFPPPFPEEDYPTLASLRTRLADTHDQTRGYLQSIDKRTLDGSFVAPWGAERPLIDFVVHVIEHEIHHRGELSLILGLLGKEGLDA